VASELIPEYFGYAYPESNGDPKMESTLDRLRESRRIIKQNRTVRSLIQPFPKPELKVQRICDLILERLNEIPKIEHNPEKRLQERTKTE